MQKPSNLSPKLIIHNNLLQSRTMFCKTTILAPAHGMRQLTHNTQRICARITITSHGRPISITAFPNRVHLVARPLLYRWSSTTSSAASKAARLAEEQLKKAAERKLKSGTSYEIAEKLLIYHAGTGRTTFLSMFKVTTLFVSAFFSFIAVPAYIKADRSIEETAAVALGGIVPLLFIAYTTAPFVTHVHIHLPPQARTSRVVLERYIRSLPPTTELTITTMSLIGKPRYSSVKAGDLRPVNKRFGLINYVRDATAENQTRKWYQFRAVSNFHIPSQRKLPGLGGNKSVSSAVKHSVELQAKAKVSTSQPVTVGKKKDLLEAWVWEIIKEKLNVRALSDTN